jgi:uncharacterized membrane protein HdeD (DUF308 family)
VCTSRAASHVLSLSPHELSSLLHVLSLSLLELLSSLHAEGFTDYRPPTISHIQGGIIVMTNTALLPQQSSIWWVFLLQGFAGVILGLMLVTQPGATIVALTTFLGFYWLITGLLGLVQVFVDRSTPWLWSLLSGIVGILAGLFVLRHPLVAALTVPTMLVLILGVQGLVMGALQIVGGFKGGGIGPFILGAINVLVGLLLLGSPIAAALAVPVVFGALLLIQGAGLIILAFRRARGLNNARRSVMEALLGFDVGIWDYSIGADVRTSRCSDKPTRVTHYEPEVSRVASVRIERPQSRIFH